MELPFKFTIGIALIGVAALHVCHGYEPEARGNRTSQVSSAAPSLERFRRLVPYMTYYLAQNLAYPDTRPTIQTGYLVPAYLVGGSSPRHTAQAPRNYQTPPSAAPTYDYPYRRYKPQPAPSIDTEGLRLLIQQQKQKQLIQLIEDARRTQQLRFKEEQHAKLFEQQLQEERRAKQLEELRRAKLLEERRVKLLEEERRAQLLEEERRAQLLEEERRAHLLEERRAKLLEEERRAHLLEERRAKLLEEERRAHLLEEERRAKLVEEERRAKQLHLILEEEHRAKLKQSRPVVVEQQLVLTLNEDEQRELLSPKEQSDISTAAAQRQQYDALLQSHNEQELANSIVPTPSTLVQITSPKSVSKLVHHIAENLKSNNELPPAISAANFDVSVKSVLRLLAELQRTKTVPIATKVIAGKEEVRVPAKTKIGVITQTFPAPNVEGSTPGRPGVDYPAYDTIPTTSFSCQTQRYKGFFGDPETNCQVWHYCDLNGGQASFLCPNGTIFSQVGLTCDWWFNVRCSSTAQLYVLNERLYKYILPMKPSFPEDYSGPVVDRYLANKFKEMQQEKKVEATTDVDADVEADVEADAEKGDKSDDEQANTDPPTTQLTLEDDSSENNDQR